LSVSKRKIDTREIGLDLWAALARFMTGKEYLHYGIWTGLDVCAANLGIAQEAYTSRLLSFLPKGPLRILDIGGGTGETALGLLRQGHRVEVVVPSEFLAGRCRQKLGRGTVVHQERFEDFLPTREYDVCLFSESFQYLHPATALDRSLSMLAPGRDPDCRLLSLRRLCQIIPAGAWRRRRKPAQQLSGAHR